MDNPIHTLPFNNVQKIDSDEREQSFLSIDEMNTGSIGNLNSRYSILTSIDPDINVYSIVDSLYYNETTFNSKYQGNDSFIHINIRNAPKNIKNFELFLQNLKCNFPII